MRAYVVVLSLCMLFTGTINTIATKYQDITVVGHLPDGQPITFNHPAVQSACMFFGESLCLIPYFYMRWRRQRAKRRDPAYTPLPIEEKRSRRFARIMAFAVPTMCDATATTAMNLGLYYTYASTYQMLRGTLVLFAGMFTILILRRQLFVHNWLGMVLITAGAALVGASSVIYSSSSTQQPGHQDIAAGLMTAATAASHNNGWYSITRVASRGLLTAAAQPASSGALAAGGAGAVPGLGLWLWQGLFSGSSSGDGGGGGDGGAVAAAPLFGDILVVAAQMFTALQFILEEKFLVKYKVPALLAVGLEGCWGLLLCCLVLPLTSVIKGPGGVPLDDAAAAMRAIFSISQLGVSVGVSILSIAFFNFFGVSVTKSLSGAARATIDACRTLFIWLYAVFVGWESFHALEVVGFVVLICGTSLYNEILKSCLPGTTLVTEHQPPLPVRRRTRASSTHTNQALTGAAAAALTAPLLDAEDGTGAVGTAEGPLAAAAADSHRAQGVPLRRPAPAHQRVYDAAQSAGSGSWVYTMARSVRLGMHALSPQSLAATAGLGQDDDGSGSEVSGSYASTGMLASSLDYGGRTPDRLSGSGLAGPSGPSQPAGSPVGIGGSSSGFRVVFADGAGLAAGEAGGSSGHSGGRPPVSPAMGALSMNADVLVAGGAAECCSN
eukprot:gene5318-5553_t